MFRREPVVYRNDGQAERPADLAAGHVIGASRSDDIAAAMDPEQRCVGSRRSRPIDAKPRRARDGQDRDAFHPCRWHENNEDARERPCPAVLQQFERMSAHHVAQLGRHKR
jgi:hypothetical protein